MGTLASVAGLSAAAMGETAPDFTAVATSGGDVTLSQFRGKKNVVLAFFP
jgi:peroxiredoxin